MPSLAFEDPANKQQPLRLAPGGQSLGLDCLAKDLERKEHRRRDAVIVEHVLRVDDHSHALQVASNSVDSSERVFEGADP